MSEMVKADTTYGLPATGMAPGLAIMFNEALYERCKQIARIMSNANGFTPRHLLQQSEACFAVVTRSITWKLDPLAVAQSTYQTPNGAVGYEGKLVQAILENSGHLEGPVTFEHVGDWSRIQGRWKKVKSPKGHEYPVQAWEDKDEEGLGVIVRAKVKGEREPREFTMWLRECFPRNSTLWALRPSQQICYTGVRAFANVAAPGLFLGVPFSSDLEDGTMIDVSPAPARPARESFEKPAEAAPQPAENVDDETGEITEPEAADEPLPEFSNADAYALGETAFAEGRSLHSAPKELSAEHQETWKTGWREAEAAKKAAPK